VIDVETDPVVVRDVYPAEVTLPDGTLLRGALVKVTREGVYVWTGERVLSYAEARSEPGEVLTPDYLTRREPLVTATADGPVVVWKGAGCGCGSTLKSYRPFQPERKAAR